MRAALRRLALRLLARLTGLPDPTDPVAVARYAYEASRRSCTLHRDCVRIDGHAPPCKDGFGSPIGSEEV